MPGLTGVVRLTIRDGEQVIPGIAELALQYGCPSTVNDLLQFSIATMPGFACSRSKHKSARSPMYFTTVPLTVVATFR